MISSHVALDTIQYYADRFVAILASPGVLYSEYECFRGLQRFSWTRLVQISLI